MYVCVTKFTKKNRQYNIQNVYSDGPRKLYSVEYVIMEISI